MDAPHPEIIIIKRHANHEAEHHGGAWKIAFADFMTAMMAFFLVLWIINATDKDTKTIIARYFNPVKLEDPAKARKGIHGEVADSKVSPDEVSGAQSPGTGAAEKHPEAKEAKDGKVGGAGVGNSSPPKTDDKSKENNSAARTEPPDAVDVKPTQTEAALFSDPYQNLDEIAGGRAALSPAAAPDTGSAPPTREAGSASLDAFRDPFKPVGPGAQNDSVTLQTDKNPPPEVGADLEPQKAVEPKPSDAPRSAAPAVEPKPSDPPHSAAPAAGPAEQLQKELQQKLGALAKAPQSPAIDVRATSDGLLISLTDRLTYSMFAIGSAEPRPAVVHAMEAVAQILKGRPGTIVLRGHTDARPYKTETYDNWRLSSARAQMAYYMLVRGGIAEMRIERVEGHADRALRDPAHPLAAENRRLEILLREPKP
jgi:chemotaxis protein MotB